MEEGPGDPGEGCSWGTFCPCTSWWLGLAPALPPLNHSTAVPCHLLSRPSQGTGAQSGFIPSFQKPLVWGRQPTQTPPVLRARPGLEEGVGNRDTQLSLER